MDNTTFFQCSGNSTDRNFPPAQSSANKLRLFRLFPRVHEYSVVVMLDVDVLLVENPLPFVGEVEPDVLYVGAEAGTHAVFNARHYTPKEQHRIKELGLQTFNAGSFIFRPSPTMQSLLEAAYTSFCTYPLVTLYEQGHLNTVFLTRGNLSYRLTHLVGLNAVRIPFPDLRHYAMLHAYGPYNVLERLFILRTHYRTLLTSPAPSSGYHPILSAILQTIHPQFKPMDAVPPAQAAYNQAVAAAGVRHVCEVGGAGLFTAAAALFHNPAAAVTLFRERWGRTDVKARSRLVLKFPDRGRLTPILGPIPKTLAHYAGVLHRGARRCDLVASWGRRADLQEEFMRWEAVAVHQAYIFLADLTPWEWQRWQERTAAGVLEEL
eukprot:EG_transcript_15402